MTDAPSVLLVSPVAPASTGNGLAMRAASTLRALSKIGPVTLVVVTLDGPVTLDDDLTSAHADEVLVHDPPPPGPDDAVSWLASVESREQLQRLQPLAAAAATATPRAVAALAERIRARHPEPFDLTVALRLRTAPWILPFADEATTVVDLDDDEVATHHHLATELRRRGRLDEAAAVATEAEALRRLADELLPAVDAVAVASPADVDAVRRHGNHRVLVAPNSVVLPGGGRGARRSGALRDGPRILFVGNLHYAPNVWAVEWLADEVLPRLLERLPVAVADALRVDVVGAGGSEIAALHGCAPVVVHDAVADLGPHYAAASLAVVPLGVGGGTRIKLLEAAARGVPVVSTTVGAAGLGLADGEQVLLADRTDSFAAACARVLVDPVLATTVGAAGRLAVEARLGADVAEANLARELRSLLRPPS